METIIVITALLAIILVSSMAQERSDKKKREAYQKRLDNDPVFKIQEEVKNTYLVHEPNIWLYSIGNGNIRIVSLYNEKIYFDGPLDSIEFQRIKEAQEKIGINTYRCKECGRFYWTNKEDHVGFCSNDCFGKCIERDKRHVARTNYSEHENIPLFELVEKQNYRCAICNGIMNDLWDEDDNNYLYHSFDHIVPISNGGKHLKWNVQVVHLICNKVKGTGPNIKIRVHVDELLKEKYRLNFFEDELIKTMRDNSIRT
jgi:hypothetical protein